MGSVQRLFKRSIILVLLLAFSLTSTGCGLNLVGGAIESLEEYQDHQEEKNKVEQAQQELSDDISKFGTVATKTMEDETREFVSDAQDALDDWDNFQQTKDDRAWYSKAFDWFTNKKGRLHSKMVAKRNEANKALSQDKKYQNAVQAEAKAKEIEERNNKVANGGLGNLLKSKDNGEKDGKSNTMFIILIILVAIVVVILIIAALLTKKPKTAPSVCKPVVSDVSTTNDVAVNYDKLLRSNCKKLGLDYDEQIATYGDVRTAAEKTQLML